MFVCFGSSQLSALRLSHVCMSLSCLGAFLRTLSQYQYLSIPEHQCFSTSVFCSGLCLLNGLLFSGLSHVPASPPYLAPLSLPQSLGYLAILFPSSINQSISISLSLFLPLPPVFSPIPYVHLPVTSLPHVCYPVTIFLSFPLFLGLNLSPCSFSSASSSPICPYLSSPSWHALLSLLVSQFLGWGGGQKRGR